MFQIFVGARYKFMARRKIAYVISSVLMLASIGFLVAQGGPKESIDFTGGSLLYVGFNQAVPVEQVRSAAAAAGMDGAEVQMAEQGTQAIIHFRNEEAGDAAGSAAQGAQSPFDRFQAQLGGVESTLLSQETVGAKVGEELEQKAAMAILWSLALILIYIAWRFTRVSFGLGAVMALFHDIVITLGIMSFMGVEISLTVVAAFLTIGGYSINDTIIVFDRIRENFGLAKRMPFDEVIDRSVNQTLSRTIITGMTTLLAVLALYILGGVVIHDFALAMLLGIIIGTYSSIFVASALALDISNWWTRRKVARQTAAAAKAKSKKSKAVTA